jgi:DNA-nicking Smr family endonuclease
MKRIEIDLHGLKHSEVEVELANAFFWKNIKEAEVITGNSIKMRKIVVDWFNKNELEYIEYVHSASYLVRQ